MNPVDVIVEMLDKGEGLMSNGIPRVSEVETRLGESVTASQRDTWYAEAKAIIEAREKKIEENVPKPQLPTKRVNRSGLGYW